MHPGAALFAAVRADGFRVLLSGLGHELAGFQDGGVAQMVKRGMTSFAVYNLVRNNEFDSSKAVAEPGYKPRPMAPSIAEEVDWMIEADIVTIPAHAAVW